MIRQGRDAVLGKELGDLLGRVAGQAVDDARVPAVLALQEGEELLLGAFLGTMRYWMFGRSNDETNRRDPASFSRMAISSRVACVAVAVSAMRGTSGQRSCSTWSSR